MKFLSLFLFLFIYQLSFAEFENGIHHDYKLSVNDGIVDRNGFLWFLSKDKLYKYDGYNFIHIDIKIKKIKLEKIKFVDDKLYILSSNYGIFCYDINKSTFLNILDLKKINDFVVLKNKHIYGITIDGTLIIKNKKKIIKHKILDINTLNSSLFFYRNILYMSFKGVGLFCFDNNKILKLNFIESKNYNGYFKYYGNKLYLINRSFILNKYIKNNNVFEISKYGKIKKILIKSFLNDFINIKNKIFYVDHRENIFEKNKMIYKNNSSNVNINYKFLQKSHSFYFISQKGIFSYRDNTYQLPKKNILKKKYDNFKIRRKILSSKDSIFFFGNPFTLLKTKNRIAYYKNFKHSVYDAIKIGSKFYLATEGDGLILTDLMTFEKKISSNCNEKDFTSLCYDSNNKILFFAGYKFIYKYNLITKTIFKYNNPLSGFAVKTIKLINKNTLFVGTDNGALLVNLFNSTVSQITELQGAVIGDVALLNNFIFVGREDGIEVYNERFKKIKFYKFLHFLNPQVSTLEISNKHELIGSTFSGVFLLNFKNDKITYLNKDNNLLNSEYNYKSICKIKDNKFIFGGVDGYDYLDVNNFHDKEKKLNYGLISGYQIINNENYNSNKFFNYSGNEITFNRDVEYLRLYHSTSIKSNNIRFYYKINNINVFNNFNNNHFIDFIGLKEGKYELKIFGYDADGNLVRFKPLMIIVNEDFFKSKLFIIILSFSIFFFSITILFYIIYLKRKRRKLLERISMDLHDEIGSYLYKSKLLVDDDDLNENKIGLIRKYIKQATFSLRIFINDIEKKNIYLYFLIDEIKEMFPEHLTVGYIDSVFITSNISKNLYINSELYRDLKYVFFEISNNYYKYSSSKKIEIRIETNTNNELFISIVQFENFKESDNKKSNGLNNIKKRIERWDGKIFFINKPKLYIIEILVKY